MSHPTREQIEKADALWRCSATKACRHADCPFYQDRVGPKGHIKLLEKLGACPDGIRFALRFKSLKSAWKACERGDWMLWYVSKACGEDRQKLVLAARACARQALKYVAKIDTRPLQAIETAETWAQGDGRVKTEHVRFVVDDTTSVYSAANMVAAVRAATYAAAAVYFAPTAHVTTIQASSAIATDSAAFDTVKKEELKKCADIVREFYPTPPRYGANGNGLWPRYSDNLRQFRSESPR